MCVAILIPVNLHRSRYSKTATTPSVISANYVHPSISGNGANGANGTNGANSTNGANATKGANGANGTNGANGGNGSNDANDANSASSRGLSYFHVGTVMIS